MSESSSTLQIEINTKQAEAQLIELQRKLEATQTALAGLNSGQPVKVVDKSQADEIKRLNAEIAKMDAALNAATKNAASAGAAVKEGIRAGVQSGMGSVKGVLDKSITADQKASLIRQFGSLGEESIQALTRGMTRQNWQANYNVLSWLTEGSEKSLQKVEQTLKKARDLQEKYRLNPSSASQTAMAQYGGFILGQDDLGGKKVDAMLAAKRAELASLMQKTSIQRRVQAEALWGYAPEGSQLKQLQSQLSIAKRMEKEIAQLRASNQYSDVKQSEMSAKYGNQAMIAYNQATQRGIQLTSALRAEITKLQAQARAVNSSGVKRDSASAAIAAGWMYEDKDIKSGSIMEAARRRRVQAAWDERREMRKLNAEAVANQWMDAERERKAATIMEAARRRRIQAAWDERKQLRAVRAESIAAGWMYEDKDIRGNQRTVAADIRRDAQRGQQIVGATSKSLGLVYDQAKSTTTKFTALGRSVYGASVLVDKFGEANTRVFLGRKSWLVDEIQNLDKYRAAVKQTASTLDNLAARRSRMALAEGKWAASTSGTATLADLKRQLSTVAAIESRLSSAGSNRFGELKSLASTYGITAVRSVTSGGTSSDSIRTAIAETTKLRDATRGAGAAAKMHRQEQAALHSTLRGVAGGMGGLWLTYGQYIGNMVAAFATVTAAQKAFKDGIEFDYQTRFVAALTDQQNPSPNLYKSIQDGLFAIKDAPANVNELARSLRVLQQTGIDAADGLGLLPTVIAASTLGEVDLKTAAEDVVGVLEVFSLRSEDPLKMADNFKHVGDVMAFVSQETKANLHDVATAMQAATGVASQYGVSLDFAAASISSLGKQGVVGSKAGTFFRNFIEEMYQPKSQKAERAFSALGVSAYDEQTGKAKDPMLMVKEMDAALSRYNSKSRDKIVADIFGERGAKQFRAIISDMEKFQQTLEATIRVQGLLEKQTVAIAQSTSYQLKQLKADWDNLFTAAFQDNSALAQPIQELRDALKAPETIQFARDFTKAVVSIGTAIVNNMDSITMFAKGLLAIGAARAALGGVDLLAHVFGKFSGGGSLFDPFGKSIAKARGELADLSKVSTVASSTVAGSLSTISNAAGAGSVAIEALKIKGALLLRLLPVVGAAITAASVAWFLFRDRSIEALDVAIGKAKEVGKEIRIALSGVEGMDTTQARAVVDSQVPAVRGLQEAYSQAAKKFSVENNIPLKDLDIKTFNADKLIATNPDKFGGETEYGGVRLLQAGVHAKALQELQQKTLEATKRMGEANWDVTLREQQEGGYATNPWSDKPPTPKPAKPQGTENYDDTSGSGKATGVPASFRNLSKTVSAELTAMREAVELDQLKLQGMRDQNLLTHAEYWDRYLNISEEASNQELAKQAEIYEKARSLLASAKGPEQKEALQTEMETSRSQMDRLIAQRRQMYERVDQGRFSDIEKPKLEFDRQIDEAKAQAQETLHKRRIELSQEVMTQSARERDAIQQDADAQLRGKERQLASMLSQGQVSQAEYDRRIEAERALRDEIVKTGLAAQTLSDVAKADPTRGLDLAMTKYRDNASNVAAATEDMFTKAFQGMEDALVSFVQTGKMDFNSLANSIISDLIRIQIRSAMANVMGGSQDGIVKLFGNILGSMMGNPASTGQISSAAGGGSYALPGGRLSAMAKGGVVSDAPGLSAYRNTVQTSPKFFSFGKLHAYAKGGVFAEAGPEAVMPLARDSNGRLGVRSQGGSATSVVVHNYGSQQATTHESTDSRGNRKIEVVIGEMVAGEQGRAGSRLYNTQRQTFGLQPTLTRR